MVPSALGGGRRRNGYGNSSCHRGSRVGIAVVLPSCAVAGPGAEDRGSHRKPNPSTGANESDLPDGAKLLTVVAAGTTAPGSTCFDGATGRVSPASRGSTCQWPIPGAAGPTGAVPVPASWGALPSIRAALHGSSDARRLARTAGRRAGELRVGID